MKMKPSLMPLLALYVMSVIGCSVKEDRSVCPCRLRLDFSGIDTSVVRYAVFEVTASDGFVLDDTLSCDEFHRFKVIDVPQEIVRVRAWYGDCGMVGTDGLSIPLGQECPPVYHHTSAVDARREQQIERVLLKKDFCRMTIVLTESDFPHELIINGCVSGYAVDGRPVEGDFRCVIPHKEGRGEVVVPRQRDASLMLEVRGEDGVKKVFALGEYVEMIGYDWSAVNLEDFTVYMDYAHSRVVIKVEKWDEEYEFNVTV